MSARLNIDRQNELEPKRTATTEQVLKDLGFKVDNFGNRLEFEFKGSKIQFWPYSGWHTGKTINDGRGFDKLLKQIEAK